MSVYYSVLVGLFGLGLIRMIKPQSHRLNRITAGGMALILTLVAGLRYMVGTDYMTYYQNYEIYKNIELDIFKEPGIKVIARLSAVILDRPETMFFIASVLTVGLMTVTIIRNSETYWLSILLYVFMCVWHGSFNGVRQYLAAAILFAGHFAIKNREFGKWLIVVLIASMFHVSAVIAILFYFFGNQGISWKQVPICGAIMLIGLTVYDKIFLAIGFLKGDELDTTISYITNSINPFRIAVAWVPVIFFLVFKRYFELNKKIIFYFNMSLLHAVLMTVASNSTYLGRIGIYTGVYNTIIWPLLLNKCDNRTRKILTILILMFYFFYWKEEASNRWLSTFRWVIFY